MGGVCCNLFPLPKPPQINFPWVNEVGLDGNVEENSGLTSSILSPFLLGITSTLLTSPCSSPVLASLLLRLSNQPTSTALASLMAYSLGYSTILVSLSFTGEGVYSGRT